MSSPDPRKVLLRLVVDAADPGAAEAEHQAITARLAPLAPVATLVQRPYWKFPDTWEVLLRLDPPDDAFTTFDRIVALAGAGWHHGESLPNEDRWAVWTRTEGASLLTPRVTWASLETGVPPGETTPSAR